MSTGTPINRQYVCMLRDGTPVVDWGNDRAQDIFSGDFVEFDESKYSHPITDNELDVLIKAGRVADYDTQTVFVHALPEPPRQTLD